MVTSVEAFILPLVLKVKYPYRLYFVQGNHENREVTLKYGFYEEYKYMDLTLYGSTAHKKLWLH